MYQTTKTLSQITLLSLVGLLCLVVASLSQAETSPPDQLIEKLFTDVTDRLNKDKEKIAADKTYLVEIGNEMLVQYISFETMAKQILGKNWRKITPEQRTRYTEAFKDRIASTVVQQYDPNRQYGLEVTGSRTNDSNDRAVVSSIVTDKTTGEKFNIAYKMFVAKNSSNWQVYDVVAEGVSVLQSFKSASAEEFRNNGIEYMIAQLEKGGEENQAADPATEATDP